MEITPIAYIKTDFPQKFALPRQSMLIPELTGKIIFEEEYRNPDALRGLDGFSHLWLIWGFSEKFASQSEGNNVFQATVRPPRLGGNKRVGVFATRSPNRPNPIGLSCVKIVKIENDRNLGPVITVSGIDMLDNTPIYDIKPYLPNTDSIMDADGGFAGEVSGNTMKVSLSKEAASHVPEQRLHEIIKILEEDPRPHYHDDEREYYFEYAGYSITFTVSGDVITVSNITERK